MATSGEDGDIIMSGEGDAESTLHSQEIAKNCYNQSRGEVY